MRTQQIVINLISNAIKFSTPNSTVKVLLKHLLNDERGNYSVSVIDTGIGINKSDMKNLF
jgi:signal transduction histidine kinase